MYSARQKKPNEKNKKQKMKRNVAKPWIMVQVKKGRRRGQRRNGKKCQRNKIIREFI